MERIAYLSLGSNLGNREELLITAIALIKKRCGKVLSIGKIYETPPLGFESDSKFLNTCVKLQTILSPKELLIELQKIELDLGRVHKSGSGYQSRLIDIDIILMDDPMIISDDSLELPHPRFRDRLFVLLPLHDIDGSLIDPITGKSISELIKASLDESDISVYKKDLMGNE